MTDLVTQTIAFDEGEMTTAEYLDFATALITTGLVNSTGSYGRFVYPLIEQGLILPDGTVTAKGHAIAAEDASHEDDANDRAHEEAAYRAAQRDIDTDYYYDAP